MFIFNLTYIKPMTVVERALPAHIAYLDEHYAKGAFLCSGPKAPRIGGVILCNCLSREQAEEIMKQDPFYKEEIARYEIIEFTPTKSAEALGQILSQ